jgi:predicted nucleic acid-binding protein
LITLDTSALLTILDRTAADYSRVTQELNADPGPLIVPAFILAELAYLAETRYGGRVFGVFLADLDSGTYTLDCGENDLPRIRALAQRYADLPLGFADASVIACAERNGGRVLTLDLRDFGVVAREGTIRILPE